MSDSVRPHRRQSIRLPCPWDSPGKNTGVGCHFLLQCTKVKSESEVTQLCPTVSDTMDCSLPGSFVHGIFQARVLEWVAIAFSNGLAYPELKNELQCILHGVSQMTLRAELDPPDNIFLPNQSLQIFPHRMEFPAVQEGGGYDTLEILFVLCDVWNCQWATFTR